MSTASNSPQKLSRPGTRARLKKPKASSAPPPGSKQPTNSVASCSSSGTEVTATVPSDHDSTHGTFHPTLAVVNERASSSPGTADVLALSTSADASSSSAEAVEAPPSTRRRVSATPAVPSQRKGKKQTPRLYTPVKVNKLELNLAYIDASAFCIEQAHKRAVESKKKKKRRQAKAKAGEAAGMGHLEPEVEADPEMEKTNRDMMAIIQKATSTSTSGPPATVRSAQWLEEQKALTAQFSSMYASNS
jgi:hypothetical protein